MAESRDFGIGKSFGIPGLQSGCLCRYIIDMFIVHDSGGHGILLRQGMGRNPPPTMLPGRVDSVNKVFDVSGIY